MKRVLVAALAVLASVTAVPAAHAGPADPTGVLFDLSGTGCSMVAFHQSDATGWNYEGIVTMAFTAPVGGVASYGPAQCVLRINGSDRIVLGPNAGVDGVFAGAGRITFTAQVIDDVALCDQIQINGAWSTSCGWTTRTQIPPQEVLDAVDAAYAGVSDAVYNVNVLVDYVQCLVASWCRADAGALLANAERNI
jgi:hypothetical protein